MDAQPAMTAAVPSTAAALHEADHAPPVAPRLDAGKLRDIVLVRIAANSGPLQRGEIARDLAPLVAHVLTRDAWIAHLDRDLGALADAGLVDVKPSTVTATDAGIKRAALVLGAVQLPRSWSEAKSIHLVASALGLGGKPIRTLKKLAKVEGLRAALVVKAFGLEIAGTPTPAKLRAKLAQVALARTFATGLPQSPDRRSAVSPKAGRALAGRLADPPRTYPTDSRLVGALAAQSVGAAKSDIDSLQAAILIRSVTIGPIAKRKTGRKRAAQAPAPAAIADAATTRPLEPAGRELPSPRAGAPAVARRPDLDQFVTAVRRAAIERAVGWSGNRKAFISQVWATIAACHPDWAVNTVEFKAMLAEAHRLGRVVLVHADLKGDGAQSDLLASAIAYRNAVFHYVRIDD